MINFEDGDIDPREFERFQEMKQWVKTSKYFQQRNKCFHTVDQVGSRVFKWRDNGDVLFVSTIHDTNDRMD
jgi:hypothetical protein